MILFSKRLTPKPEVPLGENKEAKKAATVGIRSLPKRSSVADPNVTYPREVEPEEDLPEGWLALEYAYGEQSQAAGKTYVRYKRTNQTGKTLQFKDALKEYC